MPYVYRRPFDYPQHRQAFNVWAMQGLTEATLGTGAFATFPATVSATTATDKYSRSVRFSAQGVFRRRWPFAEHNAKIVLIYADADAINAAQGAGTLATFTARVQLGAAQGASLTATLAADAFATYAATVTGGRRDPYSVGNGVLVTYQATLTRTAGLGPSRTGAVSAKPSGTYQPGSTRAPRRRVVSTTNLITRAK